MGSGGLAAKEKATATRPVDKSMTISNIFVDSDLREALQDIASQLEVVIVPDSSVAGVVTFELKDATLDQALEIVLAGTGYVVKKMPGYYLVSSASPDSPSFALISETRLVRMNYVAAATAARQLAAPFRTYVNADQDRNTLLITAPPALLKRIVDDLKIIDKAPGHIMLHARIFVLDRTRMKNVGVRWNWPLIKAGVFTNSDFYGGAAGPDWPWAVEAGLTPGFQLTNSLVLTLNLLAQNSDATVLASPRLMAQDGREAEIKVNTEEYFEITSQGLYVVSRLQKIETGTVLKILPRISENGDITLKIATEVSGVVARGENNLPVVTRRTAANTVRIRDGGTVVIAGLMDQRSEETVDWVPGIGKIPVIGRLFRTDMNQNSSRQIAIFVTASRVKDAPDAKLRARFKAAFYPPVREEEFRKALAAILKRSPLPKE
jgi:type II secretory pathway component GspD/PulD (secretin)